MAFTPTQTPAQIYDATNPNPVEIKTHLTEIGTELDTKADDADLTSVSETVTDLDSIRNEGFVYSATRGLVIDENTSKLLIPEFAIKRSEGDYEVVSPSSGLYFELDAGDLPSAVETQKVAYFEMGQSAPVADVLSTWHSNAFASNIAVLAVTSGGTIASEMSMATVVRNEIPRGAFERQLTTSTSSYRKSTSDTELTDLNIDEMIHSDDGNPQSAVRVNIKDALRPSHIFVRVFVQLGAGETADDFPSTIQALVKSRSVSSASGGGNLLGANMLLEKTYGDRLASYVAQNTRVPESFSIGGVAVIVTGEGSGRDIRLSLPQVGVGRQGDLFVQPNDWFDGAAQFEPYVFYGPDVFKIEGRPLPFFAAGLSGESRIVSNLLSVNCENSVSGNNGAAAAPFSGVDMSCVTVGADNLVDATPVRISTVEPSPYASRRATMEATASVASVSSIAAKSVDVAFIGDSITAVYPTAVRTKGVLSDVGISAFNFVGTMYTENREGRSGSTISEHVNKTTGLSAVTDVSAYNALDDAGKAALNPFIRSEVGTESGAFNGFIFDYGDYLTRFSLTTPTHVVINLGTNDIGDFDDPELLRDHIVECLGSMVPSILAADAGLKVILTVPGDRWSEGGNVRRDKRYNGLIRGVLKYAKTLGDSRCVVASTWAHMNHFDWSEDSVDTERTDTETGLIIADVSDDVHFVGAALRQYCEVVAAAIANT